MYKDFAVSQEGIPFVPLLFAGDINVYSVARAFHEAYGVRSRVYAKHPASLCAGSRIIDFNSNPAAEDYEYFVSAVNDVASELSDKKVILIGCGDSYVALASKAKAGGALADNVEVPYIGPDLMDALTHKASFYEFCEKNGVAYPDTFVHIEEMGEDFDLPFGAPFIVKPSNGVEYWRHPYPSQKKVYKAEDIREVRSILSDIYSSGYSDSVIIQGFIPGDDSFMHVLTGYSGRDGKVKMMCLGHVLLEEHTPHGLGNHAVIITEENEELTESYRALLDGIGYTGFFNFDIKYDERDGRYKAFEINTRQGRSNYYVTASGANIAKLLVEDVLDGKEIEYFSVPGPFLWSVLPKGVAFRYIRREYHGRMKELIKADRYANPLIYSADSDISRRFRLAKNIYGHYIKYKKYMKPADSVE